MRKGSQHHRLLHGAAKSLRKAEYTATAFQLPQAEMQLQGTHQPPVTHGPMLLGTANTPVQTCHAMLRTFTVTETKQPNITAGGASGEGTYARESRASAGASDGRAGERAAVKRSSGQRIECRQPPPTPAAHSPRGVQSSMMPGNYRQRHIAIETTTR